MKKTIIITIVAAVIFGACGFYGGMKYGQSKNSVVSNSGGNFANLTDEERQARLEEMGANASGAATRTRPDSGGGFANGEIISKDDKSVTIKLPDGGSKIIYFSDSTEIVKSSSGTSGDLETGKTITISGTANDDGSITAKSIQLGSMNAPAQ